MARKLSLKHLGQAVKDFRDAARMSRPSRTSGAVFTFGTTRCRRPCGTSC
jgi:hypothetical protein